MIELIELTNRVAHTELVERFGTKGCIIAVDFYVSGAEDWSEMPWGFRSGNVLNVDHHAPVVEMQRPVSSGNLATLLLRDRPTMHGLSAQPNIQVKINHLDCDSVISAGLLSGLIRPEKRWEEAVLEADHFGGENEIADALQALEQERDYDLSFAVLKCLDEGLKLPARAEELLEKRMQERKNLAKIANAAEIIGQVALVRQRCELAGCLPALLPQAKVIVCVNQRGEDRWTMKLRLGNSSEKTLQQLVDFDENYGGRWNAGSNKRGGGTTITPEAYCQLIDDRL